MNKVETYDTEKEMSQAKKLKEKKMLVLVLLVVILVVWLVLRSAVKG